jgi:asparagine synthetase B (glutamine-hydrolysing)
LQEGIDAISDVIQHIETYDVTTIRASTPMFLMSRKIKALGVKMVLSGEGSDEVFGGYLYFHKAPNRVSVITASSRICNIAREHCGSCICEKGRHLGVAMVLFCKSSDEVFGGYLYFSKAPNRVSVMTASSRICNIAREHCGSWFWEKGGHLGVPMVLSCKSSDEVFGGYLYFHKAPNRVSFMTVTRLTLEGATWRVRLCAFCREWGGSAW